MVPTETLQAHPRPLTASEKRLLASRVRALRQAARGARGTPLVVGAVVGVLWVATLLASDAPWWVATLFWIVVGLGLLVWVRREQAGDVRHQWAMADRLESALRADHAVVLDVRATRFVEFEEVEDEGACYAFEIGEARVVFIVGQEFYPEAKFPSLDFSLVYPQDEHGATVSFWMDKRGECTEPGRVVPAKVKGTLEMPEHLSVVACRLEDVERALGRPDRS